MKCSFNATSRILASLHSGVTADNKILVVKGIVVDPVLRVGIDLEMVDQTLESK
jgi:hypothetical protein